MRISKTTIPQKSQIKNYLPVIDYADCFIGEIKTNEDLQLLTIARHILNFNPGWMVWLMNLRNWLVRPFGLWTSNGIQPVLAIKKGKKAGFFYVLDITDEEILLYANNKHLSACLSIMLIRDTRKYDVAASTTVCYHNFLGRFYFFFIKPFHVIITKSMITSIITNYSSIHKTNYHEKKCFNASCCR